MGEVTSVGGTHECPRMMKCVCHLLEFGSLWRRGSELSLAPVSLAEFQLSVITVIRDNPVLKDYRGRRGLPHLLRTVGNSLLLGSNCTRKAGMCLKGTRAELSFSAYAFGITKQILGEMILNKLSHFEVVMKAQKETV